jgi:heme/copper-type cytochrome/quinol oxidase subunit 4
MSGIWQMKDEDVKKIRIVFFAIAIIIVFIIIAFAYYVMFNDESYAINQIAK